jgi:hypothetical protein
MVIELKSLNWLLILTAFEVGYLFCLFYQLILNPLGLSTIAIPNDQMAMDPKDWTT